MFLFSAVVAEHDCESLAAMPGRPEIISTRPRIYQVRRVLSDAECDALIAMAEPHLLSSELGASGSPTPMTTTTAWRNSSTTTFEADSSEPLLRQLRRRLSDIALMPEGNAEPLQVSRYAPGESFGLHTDGDILGSVTRVATLIVCK